MSSGLDEVRLLRDVQRGIAEARQTALALRENALGLAYFPSAELRWVTSRETLQAIVEERDHPGGAALRGWLVALLLLRVNLGSFRAVAQARGESLVRVREPEPRELPLREVIRTILTGSPRVREDAVACLAVAGSRLADPVVEAADRAMEIARRAGLSHLDDVYSPVPRADLAAVVSSFQRQTEDLGKAMLSLGEPLFRVLGRAAAVDVSLPFPQHLGGRWVESIFPRETGIFEIPSLHFGRLPEKLSPASFARLLARFGARYADAASACEVLPLFASSPAELRRRTLGVVFASLFVNQPFLRRALGFNEAEAGRARRAFGVVFLAHARLAAAKVLGRETLLSGNGEAARQSFADETAQALYTEVPRGLALVLPRPRLTDPGSFAALALGTSLAHRLREEFDEDWFKNPRAHQMLRDLLSRAEPLSVVQAPVLEGGELLAKSLADILG